jgi:hypothetical protein
VQRFASDAHQKNLASSFAFEEPPERVPASVTASEEKGVSEGHPSSMDVLQKNLQSQFSLGNTVTFTLTP